uniref:Uncharacterized protein n=1 Tax=Arundo donax TaxID=35708 RepID=A0A0A9AMT4_ARUDO
MYRMVHASYMIHSQERNQVSTCESMNSIP